MGEKSIIERILHLLPRVLAILFIIFVSMFALDVFGMEGSLMQKIGGFLMHLTPAYLLIIVFLIARKWEIAGGVIYVLLSVFYIFLARGLYIVIWGPLLLIGILFILNGVKSKKSD